MNKGIAFGLVLSVLVPTAVAFAEVRPPRDVRPVNTEVRDVRPAREVATTTPAVRDIRDVRDIRPTR